MSSTVLDHQSLGRSRVATQYTESQKFLAYIRALLDSSAELESVLQKVAEQSDIDLAEGVNLDVIGEIVGVSRVLQNSIALKFFGFEGQPGGDVYGDENLLGIGSRFRDELEPETATSVLADPEYRSLIRAKIVKNHANGTCEDILNGLAYLFNAHLAVTEDAGPMAINIAVGRWLTFTERAILLNFDLIARPAGVRVAQLMHFNADSYFGFEGQSMAKSFSEETQNTFDGSFELDGSKFYGGSVISGGGALAESFS